MPKLTKYDLCLTINVSYLLDIPQIQLYISHNFFNINKSQLKVINTIFLISNLMFFV